MKNKTKNLIQVTEANFEEIKNASPILLIDFSADWCPHCQVMEQIMHELADQYALKATIGRVDVEESTNLAVRFQVRNLPSILVFRQGELLHKYVGLMPKRVLDAQIQELLPNTCSMNI
ncbi:thioredoxin family protein [Rhodocytophaga aerolata]|uniref:Thioredoxin n=1 Tax=Rhodocytophaga aerolata TaxID=455078 RepID=A0ABT8RDR8_9BACT|nr:thioredoxin family protein [Rhodocytophaga aerolata]MDO1450246.1 thioredoxin family protein [Rhodocytophaga aerolata]